MSTQNPWKKKVEEQGINPDDFVELARSGGKLTDASISKDVKVVVSEENESGEANVLEALLKELRDIESGKKKAGKHKKLSISLDAVTYLKIEIMKKKFEEGFFMEVPLSKVIGSAVDEHYETKYRKSKKPKAP